MALFDNKETKYTLNGKLTDMCSRKNIELVAEVSS